MAPNRCFVQFPHPGREHEPDRGPDKAWQRQEHKHGRKFLLLRGEWVDEHGNRKASDLHAWGEWEAESELVSTLPRPSRDSLQPRCLWRPYYIPKTSYEGLHNTDPFIFGRRFLYSNCGQPTRPGLRQLAEGSVIAFGSSKKVRGVWRWMLDTVLVIRDFKDYPWSDARRALRDWASSTFLDVTIGPLTGDSGQPTPEGCAPTPPPACARPNDASSAQSPKGLRRDRTSDELRGLWDRIVAQVHAAGLVLGTYAELPERRGKRKRDLTSAKHPS